MAISLKRGPNATIERAADLVSDGLNALRAAVSFTRSPLATLRNPSQIDLTSGAQSGVFALAIHGQTGRGENSAGANVDFSMPNGRGPDARFEVKILLTEGEDSEARLVSGAKANVAGEYLLRKIESQQEYKARKVIEFLQRAIDCEVEFSDRSLLLAASEGIHLSESSPTLGKSSQIEPQWTIFRENQDVGVSIQSQLVEYRALYRGIEGWNVQIHRAALPWESRAKETLLTSLMVPYESPMALLMSGRFQEARFVELLEEGADLRSAKRFDYQLLYEQAKEKYLEEKFAPSLEKSRLKEFGERIKTMIWEPLKDAIDERTRPQKILDALSKDPVRVMIDLSASHEKMMYVSNDTDFMVSDLRASFVTSISENGSMSCECYVERPFEDRPAVKFSDTRVLEALDTLCNVVTERERNAAVQLLEIVKECASHDEIVDIGRLYEAVRGRRSILCTESPDQKRAYWTQAPGIEGGQSFIINAGGMELLFGWNVSGDVVCEVRGIDIRSSVVRGLPPSLAMHALSATTIPGDCRFAKALSNMRDADRGADLIVA